MVKFSWFFKPRKFNPRTLAFSVPVLVMPINTYISVHKITGVSREADAVSTVNPVVAREGQRLRIIGLEVGVLN